METPSPPPARKALPPARKIMIWVAIALGAYLVIQVFAGYTQRGYFTDCMRLTGDREFCWENNCGTRGLAEFGDALYGRWHGVFNDPTFSCFP